MNKENQNQKKITLLSITQKIDDIFNSICQKINEFLGKKTFLKFFLRRMICGCEFGICLDFKFESTLKNDPTILIDKDPLFLFTLNVRSLIPILAGILILVLVYLATIAKKIFPWFAFFPSQLTKEVTLRCISVVVDVVAPELAHILLDKIIFFLEDSLNKQLEKLNTYDLNNYQIVKEIISIINSSIVQDVAKMTTRKLSDLYNITLNWQKLMKKCLDPMRMMKISFLILMNLAVFMMIFNCSHKEAINHSKSDTEQYDKNPTQNELNKLVENNENIVKLDGEISNDEKAYEKIKESYEKVSQSYKFKYLMLDPLDKFVKLSDFYEENREIINDGIAIAKNFIQKKGKTKCKRIHYSGIKQQFIQQVVFYATNQFPSILQMIGYSRRKHQQYLFVENKEKGTLDRFISKLQNVKNKQKKFNITNKLIISYGLACAIKHLHKNQIIHRNIKPSNIYLDSNLYPYLSDFYMAKQVEIDVSYKLAETTIEFMSPEFIKNYENEQNSFKLDIYSFGVTIFMLITESNSFDVKNGTGSLRNDILDGKRPEIPDYVDQEWRSLISECWKQDPELRPDISTICDLLESSEFVNSKINIKAFNSYKKIIQNHK